MLSTTFISNNLKSLDIKDIDLKMAQAQEGTKENDDERSFKALDLMGKKPFKILLLGDTYVGKSTLLQNLISGDGRMAKVNCAQIGNEYMPTIGIDFKRKVSQVISNSQIMRKTENSI